MMRNVPSIERAVAVLLVCLILSAAERGAAATAPGQSGAPALLDVPYVSQGPALCAEAAVAMVLRYWGERGVVPQDFAPIARAGDGGMPTGGLASAVRDRGWRALVVPADGDPAHTRIRSEIDRGRPLLALIEVEPHLSRHVVIVGATDQEVVFHDPARAPFRVLHLGDWSTSWLRWQTGAALDRLREYGDADKVLQDTHDYVSADGTLSARLAADRLALTASASWWTPLADGNGFGAAWRTTGDAGLPSWSAVTEMSVASRAAPLPLWQGAGTGQARSGLLRAHPLLHDGVLTGPVFGRDVEHASLEYARPVKSTRAGRLSVAGFVDAAQAWHRLSGLGTSPLYVDAGVGLRVNGPGPGGAIRIDIAHGLRGGGTTISASWGGAGRR